MTAQESVGYRLANQQHLKGQRNKALPSIFDRIYRISPVWLQNLGISAYGLVWHRRRFGGAFPAYVQQCLNRERFTAQEWEDYQTKQLRLLLVSAVQNVPYYREHLGGPGRNMSGLAHLTLHDLPSLPLLDKESVRTQSDRLLNRNTATRRLHTYSTSGTTGTPLEVRYTNDMHRQWSAAYETRVRRWAGVNHRMSRAMIGGRMVVPEADANPPFWRFNRVERQLYMSAFHLSPANAPHYVSALNDHRPDYLVGYASTHYFLARMIVEAGLNVYRPRAILTSSEKLTVEMRATMESAYGCPVFDAYSGVEACCLASECEHHRMHISPDVGIVELLDDAGQPVPSGELGEIVATGLLNHDQPLIRYRTGDLARLSCKPCPCGRQMPVIKEIVGRIEDVVIGHDGRELVRFHGIFVGLPHVREGQVVQEGLTRFRLRLAVDPGFGESERSTILTRFEQRLGTVQLSFEYVDRVERTPNGKFRAVVSMVPRGRATQ
jgi:phenylacetate-CoA ligase